MLCVKLSIMLVVVVSYIDETEHLFVVGSVSRLDEVGSSVYNLLRCRTPIVTSCLIEQVDILLAGVHLAPAHTADVRVHTADTIVVVPSREF